jgi:hypothetical protein
VTVFSTVWKMPRTVGRTSRAKDLPVVIWNIFSEKVSRENAESRSSLLDREEQGEQRKRDHAHGPGDSEPVSLSGRGGRSISPAAGLLQPSPTVWMDSMVKLGHSVCSGSSGMPSAMLKTLAPRNVAM